MLVGWLRECRHKFGWFVSKGLAGDMFVCLKATHWNYILPVMGGPLKFLSESLSYIGSPRPWGMCSRSGWEWAGLLGTAGGLSLPPSTSHCLNHGLAVAAKTRSKMATDCDDLRKGRLGFFKQLWKRVSSRAIVCNLQSVLPGRLILNGDRQRTDIYSCPSYLLQ